MPLVTAGELLKKAEKEGYAVGAFNCNNMEIVQAIIEAAEEEEAPVIIQASQGAIKYAGLKYISALALTAIRQAGIPAALHLDHGTDFAQILHCIREGFTSVMIDGSMLPLEENISLTRKVLEVARPLGVSVEAELGRVGGTEDEISVDELESSFTDPGEARRFVEDTGVDSLAVAIGTAHGVYQGEPKLDFERLRLIREAVKVPIVLHGSSGVPGEAVKKAIGLGVRKVNIDTNIRESFMKAVREFLEEFPEEIDPRRVLGAARRAAKDTIKEKIRLFGSSQKGRGA